MSGFAVALVGQRSDEGGNMRKIWAILEVSALILALSGLTDGIVVAATPGSVHPIVVSAVGTSPPADQQVQQARARFATQSLLPHAGQSESLTHPDQDAMGSAMASRFGASARTGVAKTHAQQPASTVAGLDVSNHQGNVNWSQVAGLGAAFAYAKTTEGTYYTSPSFGQQYNGSYQAGLIRGAYHFAIPNNSTGAAQADYFVADGGGWSADGRTLPGMLDLEYNPYGTECYGLNTGQMVTWVASFDSEYHLLTGRWPDIYTSSDWWSTCTGNSAAFSQESLSIASWSSNPPALPRSWTTHTFWQWADSGSFPGDQEWFDGDRPALVDFALGTTAGAFTALNPTRVLDTRTGNGAPEKAVAPWNKVTLRVTGLHGVPASGVSAVALNVTATATTAPGFLTVYPDGVTRPMASNLNYEPMRPVANLVIIPVGADGMITLFNGSVGTAQFIADLSGYYSSGKPSAAGTFGAVGPVRVLDTRIGAGAPSTAVRPWQSVSVQIAGTHGIPRSGVAAVVLNLTATQAAAAGYLTAYPDSGKPPVVSNLNFRPAQTIADLAVVPVGADGRIAFLNGSSGTVQIIADLAGYYLSGPAVASGTLQPVSLKRVLDTQIGLGAPARAVPPNGSISLQVTGVAGVVATGVSALIASVTVVSPGAAGYLTAYPAGYPRPNASAIDFAPGQTVANLVVVPVGAGGRVQFTNTSGGTVQLLVDFIGYFVGVPARAPQTSPCNSVPPDPAGTAITRWDPITLCVLSSLGRSASDLADVDTLIVNESGGDPNAINLYDINAQQGHPSEGLIQVIQPTFDQYRSAQLPNNLYDPAANLYAGLNYAVQTYGSIHNIPGLVSLRNGGGYQGYVRTRR
jgi:GH25 family lysozyme M1 (1,4-beta-N-acetylmuramidase)